MRIRLTVLLTLLFIGAVGMFAVFAEAGPNSRKTPTTRAWDPFRDGIGDLSNEVFGKDLVKGLRRPLAIEGKLYTPVEFAKYVRTEVMNVIWTDGHWRPSSIVLHNTFNPTIASRPNGFSADNMMALADYYGRQQGWSAGPAAFIDQNGIWVFSGFLKPGVHSPSWNSVSWGIEQLGDFSVEDYESGAGKKIRDNSIAALAILSIAAKVPLTTETLHLHKEDVLTTHKHCPGSKCDRGPVLTDVEVQTQKWRSLLQHP